jgi:hypothetical protein
MKSIVEVIFQCAVALAAESVAAVMRPLAWSHPQQHHPSLYTEVLLVHRWQLFRCDHAVNNFDRISLYIRQENVTRGCRTFSQ